jgi:hypothetical protein
MASQIAVSTTRTSDMYGDGYQVRVYLASVAVDEKGEPCLPGRMTSSVDCVSRQVYTSATRKRRIVEAAGRLLAQEVNAKNMTFEDAKAAFMNVDLRGIDLSLFDRWL